MCSVTNPSNTNMDIAFLYKVLDYLKKDFISSNVLLG